MDGPWLLFFGRDHDTTDQFGQSYNVLDLSLSFWNEWFSKWCISEYHRWLFREPIQPQNDEHLSWNVQFGRRSKCRTRKYFLCSWFVATFASPPGGSNHLDCDLF